MTELATKAFFGNLSKEEQFELDQYFEVASSEERKAFQKLFDRQKISTDLNRVYEADAGFQRVEKRLFTPYIGRARMFSISGRRTIITIAAALLVFIAGAFLWQANFKKETRQGKGYSYVASNRIVPVGNRATLTLADGKTIVLDSAASGALAEQGGTNILKDDAGNITYQPFNNSQAVGYNTVATPRGGQFRVTLPDATKVWLNTSSSIRFPTAFTGSERRVEITGEVYFEVTKDKMHPFIATVGNSDITVLGTHFNTKAYPEDGPVLTTLLEGSVKVSAPGNSIIIAPGQQAKQTGDKLSLIKNVNTEYITQWKDGSLAFSGEDIESVMRVIKRFYDVEVVFKGQTTSKAKIEGTIPSNSDINAIVKMLELSGYHLSIQGKTIYVLP
jgi:ferric-dicitrate binding protein FerR (iron transport regulator)